MFQGPSSTFGITLLAPVYTVVRVLVGGGL